MNGETPNRPSRWAFVAAFTIVYLAWGTTYLAIKEGVKTLPPALFGGTRLFLAGLMLLLFLAWRGKVWRLPNHEFLWAAASGAVMFMGGNGLISLGLQNRGDRSVDSALAAVLVASTPLWMAIIELLLPRGE